jgi:alpha-beta hydrolase superfamily lysophospholipase
LERSIAIANQGEGVPCVLWTPELHDPPYPLVLAGHGFTLHKRALFPSDLVETLNKHGVAVAALDAPGHGERAPGGDAANSDPAWREHWRRFGAERIAAEHSAAIDDLVSLPEIAGPVGYWGLSLGTQYGVGVLAAEPRIVAAVLGLSALPDPGPRIAAYAAGVRCPVFFIQQLDDEIAERSRSTALFEALGTTDKTLRASPGGHVHVPAQVFEEAYNFLLRHVRA